MSPDKQRVLDLATEFVCPHRVKSFEFLGINLVMADRHGYRFRDVDRREFLDFHLNGGVFNLGHRNPELVEVLRKDLEHWDIGNHHFPSAARAELARDLARCTPGELQYSVFASGGGEAIDAAIKTARHFTKRKTIVTIERAYHGHTGLALAAGDARYARMFFTEGLPGEFVHVPFNDLDAIRDALSSHSVAAVLLETIPATLGFPLPAPDYLPRVKRLCEEFGTLYIADEVQTGLARTGKMWGVDSYSVVPDILVTGKGLSGGLYPIAAAVLSRPVASWLHEDGWGHVSTFGGAELGCGVARKVLEICLRPETLQNARAVARQIGDGLRRLQAQYADWIAEIRQNGLVIGIRLNHPQGGMLMAKALYDAGVWAMFAGYDTSVLQFKPGLLLDSNTCDEALERFETAVKHCRGSLA
jgi:acetylornithine/succinyldiaminopimelate/putrescine aminotransferase